MVLGSTKVKILLGIMKFNFETTNLAKDMMEDWFIIDGNIIPDMWGNDPYQSIYNQTLQNNATFNASEYPTWNYRAVEKEYLANSSKTKA
jgi:hypothetical membrane protein